MDMLSATDTTTATIKRKRVRMSSGNNNSSNMMTSSSLLFSRRTSLAVVGTAVMIVMILSLSSSSSSPHHVTAAPVEMVSTTTSSSSLPSRSSLPSLSRKMEEQNVDQDEDSTATTTTTEEEEQMLSLTFSLWHPDMEVLLSAAMTDAEEDEAFQTLLGMMKLPVLDAIQQFFCDDTSLVVIDDDFNSVCSNKDGGGGRRSRHLIQQVDSRTRLLRGGGGARSSTNSRMLQSFLQASDPDNSYIANVPTNLIVSPYANDDIDVDDGSTNNSIQYWWTWQLNYRLEQIGTQLIEQATMMNATDNRQYMQDVTQLALDVSIMDGMMNTRLQDTAVYMSMVGEEIEMFRQAADHYASTTLSSDADETSGEDDDEVEFVPFVDADYGSNGQIVQYLGIGMIVINLFVVTTLTLLARRRRRQLEKQDLMKMKKHKNNKNNKNKATQLVTEQSVNHMLETGRRNSEQYALKNTPGYST